MNRVIRSNFAAEEKLFWSIQRGAAAGAGGVKGAWRPVFEYPSTRSDCSTITNWLNELKRTWTGWRSAGIEPLFAEHRLTTVLGGEVRNSPEDHCNAGILDMSKAIPSVNGRPSTKITDPCAFNQGPTQHNTGYALGGSLREGRLIESGLPRMLAVSPTY